MIYREWMVGLGIRNPYSRAIDKGFAAQAVICTDTVSLSPSVSVAQSNSGRPWKSPADSVEGFIAHNMAN